MDLGRITVDEFHSIRVLATGSAHTRLTLDFFVLESSYFCQLGAHANSEPYDNPFWDFIYGTEKENKKIIYQK